MLNWTSESGWKRLVRKTTWRWWWKDNGRDFLSETLPHRHLLCTWTCWPQSNTPALSRMVNLSYPWIEIEGYGGINNCVSHIGSFTPGPDAIFKKSSLQRRTWISNRMQWRRHFETMCGLWIRWVLKPYERIACGKFTLRDPRGDFVFFSLHRVSGPNQNLPSDTSRKLDEAGCTKETRIH